MSLWRKLIEWCQSPEKIRVARHYTPRVALFTGSILIASILLLQLSSPPPINPSVSQGVEALWSLGLCEYPKPLSEYVSYISATIPVPDIDGDGISDIVAGAMDNNTYCLSGADGSILWKQNLGRGVRNVWAVPSQEKDGFNVVASTANHDSDHNGETYLLSGRDGSEIWEFSKGSAILLVPDIDSDGVPEIVTQNKGSILRREVWGDVLEYNNISLLSGASGEEFWNSNVVGSFCTEIFGSRCAVSIENLNFGIIACWYDVDVYRPYVVSFDLRSGEKVWSCQVFRPMSIVLASITGEADVIVGAVNGSYVISGVDGEVVWERNFPSERVPEADVIQDIDGDDANDVIAGSVVVGASNTYTESRVRLLSGANGTTMWEHTLEPYLTGLTTVQDLNEDGVSDVVVVATDVGEDYVYLLSGVDGEMLGEHVLPDSRFISELVVIPDVNGDGFQDIIIISQSSVSDEDRYYRIFLLAPDLEGSS